MSSLDTSRMSAGEPGLPKEFTWRKETVAVKKVLRHWRTAGPCRHGSGEMYLRKHWYEIETASGKTMKVYFQKPTKGKGKDAGWWVFSLKNKPAET
ncbi:MAG: cytoplasmic protein [Candidatus Omnitrophica bacterium]|nr:cytoplasmic protein [Candidatus Omnitrophota bacterium]